MTKARQENYTHNTGLIELNSQYDAVFSSKFTVKTKNIKQDWNNANLCLNSMLSCTTLYLKNLSNSILTSLKVSFLHH